MRSTYHQIKMFCWIICSTILLTSVSSTETVVRSLTDSAPIQSNTIQRIVTVLENKGNDETRALKKVFLSNRSITCNDGSQSGFYLRKSHTSKKWIIFLEGGWYCYDNHTCRNRWLRLRHLMTSSQWPETRDVGGILSPNPEENPFWWNANHVFVPYCTSDSWSGTRMSKEGMFTFMGALVVQQVILDLIPLGLDNSTDILLTGSSAGGTGAMLNLDPVRELLHTNLRSRRSRPSIRGVCDSGWFLDRAPYAPTGHRAVEAIRKGMEMWKGRVPKRCERVYRDEPWRCYFGYRLYPTLKSPLFVFQWLFDEAQMTVDNVGAPVTKQQWDYIHKMGDALRHSFENVTAVFAPSCISHSVLTKRDWQLVKVNDVSIAHALQCWEQQSSRKNNRINDTRNIPTIKAENKGIAKIKRNNDRRKNTEVVSSTEATNKRRRRKKHKNRDRDRNLRKNKKHKGRHQSEQINSTNTTQSPEREREHEHQHQTQHGHQSQSHAQSQSQHSHSHSHSRSSSAQNQNQKQRNRHIHFHGACQHRLLERCTWPQCNHSCPKLHNPFTGEEMDFIELLKSFGLDMESVANALGIDMQTLNNMDPGELLNLLTQQAN